MMELYTYLLSQLKNFWQYICIGAVLVGLNYYHIDSKYLIGCIFISLGIATLLGKITDIVKAQYIAWKEKKSQQKRIEEQKFYFINEYNNLSQKEKEIVDWCLCNKTLTFDAPTLMNTEWVNRIYSLVGRRLGNNITYGGDFMMNKLCFDTLLEYIEKNKDKKNG